MEKFVIEVYWSENNTNINTEVTYRRSKNVFEYHTQVTAALLLEQGQGAWQKEREKEENTPVNSIG